jgi:hypothetical protein
MFSYCIDEDKNLIKTKADGEISVKDLSIHMDKVVNDEKYTQGMNTIVDLTKVFLNMSIADIFSIKQLLKKQEGIRKKGKWAIFVESSTIKSMLSFAVSTITLKEIKMKVFDNEKEAMDWIEKENK